MLNVLFTAPKLCENKFFKHFFLTIVSYISPDMNCCLTSKLFTGLIYLSFYKNHLFKIFTNYLAFGNLNESFQLIA